MMRKKTGISVTNIAPAGEGDSPVGALIPGWAGICAEVHKSRLQLWRDIRDGRFPAPIETGDNSIAWLRSEVTEWIRSRPRRTYRPAA